MNNTHVRCFTGATGLLQLEPAWRELFASSVNPSFYNDWRWHYAIQKHLFDRDIHYFAVYKDELLVAIVPLSVDAQRRKGLPISVLDFPRHSLVDCADMVVRKGKAHPDILHAVLAHIQRHQLLKWDLLRLSLFTDRSATVSVVGANKLESQWLGAYVRRDQKGQLLGRLSRKQIKNARRCLKQAEAQHGSVTLVRASSPAELDEAYTSFLNIEASGWKGKAGTRSALRLQANTQAFYRTLLNSFGESGQAVVNLLHIGGHPAAAQLGIQTSQTLSLLKIGYDEALRGLGPGAMALLKCLEELPPELPEVSLVTDPAWARRWHFASENLWHTMYFNNTVYGQALRLLYKSRQLLRTSLGKRL